MDKAYRVLTPATNAVEEPEQQNPVTPTPLTRPSTPNAPFSGHSHPDLNYTPPSERNRWTSPPSKDEAAPVLGPAYSPENTWSKHESIITRIGVAGHELLFMAENETYIELYNLSNQLKEEVARLKAENAGLRFGFERLAQMCSHRCEATALGAVQSDSTF